MGEKVLRINGIELCVETFGEPGTPAILLIGGASGSMDWWEDEFCARLEAGGRFVIRYDHRDTGRSTSSPPGEPGYGMPDLVADVVALLDELEVRRAHLVGISMGGGIAQRMAVAHPDRVASLTLLSTSPGGPGGDGLPPMSPRLQAHFADSGPEPDWADRSAYVDFFLAGERVFAGSLPVDEPPVR